MKDHVIKIPCLRIVKFYLSENVTFSVPNSTFVGLDASHSSVLNFFDIFDAFAMLLITMLSSIVCNIGLIPHPQFFICHSLTFLFDYKLSFIQI